MFLKQRLVHEFIKRIVSNHLKSLLAGVILFAGIAITIFFNANEVFAFEVDELPSGNLIENPWFRDAENPSFSGLDGWTDAAGLDENWSSSQKSSNPAHEIIISGVCGFEPVYCGTAARLSDKPGESGGTVELGEDAYLYQVAEADPAHTKLKFFTHWVSHLVDPAEVQILGSDSPDGPWSLLWTPFYHEQSVIIIPPGGDTALLWEETGMLEHSLESGYPYYKVQIHARLPESEKRGGFKITGVYFTTEIGESTPTPEPTLPPATSTPRVPPTPTPEPTSTPEPTPTVDDKDDTMFVGDLDGDAIARSGDYWAAITNVKIKDDQGNSLANASVNGYWSIGTSSVSGSCMTDSSGICQVGQRKIEQSESDVTFTVTNVTHSSYIYDSSENTDPDGDSNGTTLQISRP